MKSRAKKGWCFYERSGKQHFDPDHCACYQEGEKKCCNCGKYLPYDERFEDIVSASIVLGEPLIPI